MTITPWLSILIPAYNIEEFIAECIKSVLNQSQANIEIIVVDDCSTDKTNEIVQTLAKGTKTPIRLFKQVQTQGVSAARNKLLDEAEGDYLWFIDSDDVMHDGAIAELKTIITKHNPDLVMCNFSVLRKRSTLKHKLRGELNVATFNGAQEKLQTNPLELFEGLFEKRNLHLWSKISKRSLWGTDLRCPPGQIMEDVTVTPQLFLRVHSYYYHPKPWIKYRQRDGSILATRSQKKIDDTSIALTGIMYLWLKKHPTLSKSARFAFSYFCIHLHICVVRDMRILHKDPNVDLSLYRQRFFDNIQWEKAALYTEYVKRGWFLRLARFIREH